jgi:hypothetical protein
MTNSFARALFAIALLLSTGHARAQLGIYGQFGTTHDPTISGWYKGFTAGGYGNFLNAGPIHLGVDVRGSYQMGDQYNYRNFLIGPRLQVKPPVLPLRPYLQAAIGFGGSRYTGYSGLGSHYSNKLQYGIIGGLDFTVLPHVDLRIPEVGYLRESGISSGAPAKNVDLVSLGFGLVVRL